MRLSFLFVASLITLGCGQTVVTSNAAGSYGGAPTTTTGMAGASSSGCAPVMCAALGFACGPASDGCGGLLDCGTCPSVATCGGGCDAKPHVCGCCPKTCAEQGLNCGMVGDGCGGTLDCGVCTGKCSACGVGGVPNVCGFQGCCPKTCIEQGFNCGMAPDGCTGILDCGPCPSGKTCGGGGTLNVCG